MHIPEGTIVAMLTPFDRDGKLVSEKSSYITDAAIDINVDVYMG